MRGNLQYRRTHNGVSPPSKVGEARVRPRSLAGAFGQAPAVAESDMGRKKLKLQEGAERIPQRRGCEIFKSAQKLRFRSRDERHSL